MEDDPEKRDARRLMHRKTEYEDLIEIGELKKTDGNC